MQTINGLAYLLASSTSGQEWVDRYTADEMAELFTLEEQKELARGGAVIQEAPRSTSLIRFVDMIAAARTVR